GLSGAEAVIPFAAAVLFALWPGGIETGESGEPEAFFVCLLLGTCLSWERGASVTAGVLLALAALTRYESWVLPGVFLALWFTRRRTPRGAAVWVTPGVAIVAWCGVHAVLTHEPLEFLRVNHDYVRGAWQELRLQERRTPAVQHPWVWYPYLVPRQSLGDTLWLCIPGGLWLLIRGPRALTVTGTVLLAFITVVWVRRMNLGL